MRGGVESLTRGYHFSRRKTEKNDTILKTIKRIKAAEKELCRAIDVEKENVSAYPRLETAA